MAVFASSIFSLSNILLKLNFYLSLLRYRLYEIAIVHVAADDYRPPVRMFPRTVFPATNKFKAVVFKSPHKGFAMLAVLHLYNKKYSLPNYV